MNPEHRDLTQLKQDALDKVIFHMTPKEWITESGPWVLDRGDGALLYDVEGREYLDAMAGGLFAMESHVDAVARLPSDSVASWGA